ncbi:MAG TPA: response regulator [Candidatus Angelobacter sp.]|nr:response regulator [Candidatus Angelobacter sp.]
MRALVIDDSTATRGIIKQMLCELGFTTFEAADGRAGLERLHELGNMDLVLVDWNMPGMDGIEFLRALRAEALFATLPVLMVSTNNDAEKIATSLEAGASEYIMKPFTEEIIRSKLELLGFFQETTG